VYSIVSEVLFIVLFVLFASAFSILATSIAAELYEAVPANASTTLSMPVVYTISEAGNDVVVYIRALDHRVEGTIYIKLSGGATITRTISIPAESEVEVRIPNASLGSVSYIVLAVEKPYQYTVRIL